MDTIGYILYVMFGFNRRKLWCPTYTYRIIDSYGTEKEVKLYTDIYGRLNTERRAK